MPTPAQLKTVLTALEALTSTQAGNENIDGLWRKIALALEEGSGTSSSANNTELGWMTRAAVAAEAQWGGSGAEENSNEAGLLKRIVDAMELDAGVGTGSLANRLAVAAAGVSFGGASAITNTAIPIIVGTPEDGTSVTFDLGIWEGPVDRFEAALYDADDNVAGGFNRQAVEQDDTFLLTGVVGETLTLRVWAIDASDNEVSADSAEFGPVLAGGDLLILAAVIQKSTLAPTPPSSPIAWTPLVITTAWNEIPSTTANPNEAAINAALGTAYNLDYGYAGTFLTGAPSENSGATDDRRKGRDGGNASMGNRSLLIDVPGPGKYLIYAGLGYNSGSVGRNLCIRPGSAVATPLLDFTNASQASTIVTDAAGTNHASLADWINASGNDVDAGAAVEITVGGTPGVKQTLYIGRGSAAAVGTQLNCIAVFWKEDQS